MNKAHGLFNVAAAAAFIDAIVHIAGSFMAGFENAVIPVAIAGGLWLLLALGLSVQKRWLAYFAFLLAVVSGLFTYSQLGSNTPLPQWSILAIIVLDLIIAVVLFVLIWRRSAYPLQTSSAD